MLQLYQMSGVDVTGNRFSGKLCEIGIYRASFGEVKELAKRFEKEVEIGWNRPKGSEFNISDGGLMAVRTGIIPITQKEWERVSEGSLAVAASFAGTNWISVLLKKSGSGVKILCESRKVFPLGMRRFEFGQFTGEMASEIEKVLGLGVEAGEIKNGQKLPVAISFGFPIRSVRMDYGNDASLIGSKLSKNWEITDWQKDQFIGLEVIKMLFAKWGREVEKIFIDNDCKMILSDVGAFPGGEGVGRVGFVFGTGVNACEGEVNFESGVSSRLISGDRVFEKMRAKGLIDTDYPVTEHWMGGDYLKGRLASALEVLSEEGILPGGKTLGEYILACGNPSIVSDFASGKKAVEAEVSKLKSVDNKTVGACSEIARNILSFAGQLAGIQIAVVARHAGLGGTARIPIEGSVFHRGFGVSRAARETVDLLLPGNGLIFKKASSLTGACKFAMVKTNYIDGISTS